MKAKATHKYFDLNTTVHEDKIDEPFNSSLIQTIQHYTILVELHDGLYTEIDPYTNEFISYKLKGNKVIMLSNDAQSEYWIE